MLIALVCEGKWFKSDSNPSSSLAQEGLIQMRMVSSQLTKTSPIIIVGAGCFGLSTALHLGKAGYENVTVFDYQPYDENEYSTTDGADAASADLNKVMRMSYGNDILYQRLAFEAAAIWKDWNIELSKTRAKNLPKGLSPDDILFDNCGFLRLSGDGEKGLSQVELSTLDNLAKEGLRSTQYVLGDLEDEQRAPEGYLKKFDALKRKERGQTWAGVFDSTAGYVKASKASNWTKYLARRCGVKFVLGDKGRLASILKAGGKTVGIKTADGVSHSADLVVVAAGGWTPSILPPVRKLLEATAGSVAYVQLPKSRQDLWERFAPENFPVYAFGGWSKGAGLGGFPRTDTGIMKIGFRGKKYTNYATVESDNGTSSERVSVPKTRYTEESETRITKEALSTIKGFISSNLPELKPFGISGVRNCFYTDSIDNEFLVSRIPGDESLVVCSGGSGHGFKFLPILGREVLKIIESKGADDLNDYGKKWQWRDKKPGEPRNGLEEGEAGPRVWKKAAMAEEADYQFDDVVTSRAKL